MTGMELFALVPAVLTTVEAVDDFIRKLLDHRRTLSESISDGDKADAELDATLRQAREADDVARFDGESPSAPPHAEPFPLP